MMLSLSGLGTAQATCEGMVPWYCGTWGFPLIIDTLNSGACEKAWDMYESCKKAGPYGGITTPPGAGQAPDIAADPNVNYNDPAVMAEIMRQQGISDVEDYRLWVEDTTKNIGGGADTDKDICGKHLIKGVSNCWLIGGGLLLALYLAKK